MSCPICNYNLVKVLKTKCRDQYFNLEGEFSIVKCKSCNFVYTNPYITGSDLFKYYPDNYAPYNEENVHLSSVNKISKLNKIRTKLLPNSPHLIPSILPQNSNILEIGCSHGSFLLSLKQKFPNIYLTGIELNKVAADIASSKGFEIINTPFENIDFNKKFDFIFLWMVFEHLPFPQIAIDKFDEITNTNAEVIFSIPNLDSIEYKIFGKYAQHVDIPRHLNFFTHEVLIELFNKRGFCFIKKVNIYNPVPFFRSLSIFLENTISPNNFISTYLNKYENQPFKTLGSKLILYFVGFPIMFLQRIVNKTPGVIYVFKKK